MTPQRVLVTGAFGNLGRRVVARLLSSGHHVRAFDLPPSGLRRLARARPPGVESMFGDLTRSVDVERAVEGVDAIAHFAAVLPPVSERHPARARAVNVGGTRALIEAASRARPGMPFVFASSCSVYGPGAGARGLAGPESPTEATDVYTETKLAAEAALRDSGLAWVILRVGASIEGAGAALDPIVMRLMFEIDPDNPVELVHGRDVANAAARAIEVTAAHRRVLPIGGGPTCRIRQRELLALGLGAVGVRGLPESAYGAAPYYTCWLDTAASQALLAYQENPLARIRADVDARFRLVRPWVGRVGPIAVRALLRLSGPHCGAPARPTFGALIESGY